MMNMITESMKTCKFDREKAFKSLFLTNSLNGDEDHLVSKRLYGLIGPDLVQFREELLAQEGPKSLELLLKTITPPKVACP